MAGEWRRPAAAGPLAVRLERDGVAENARKHRRAAALGVRPRFEYSEAAPSPLTSPSRSASKGRGAAADRRRGGKAEHLALHPLDRMNPRADAAGNHHVGLAALEDPHGLGHGREARYIAQRDACCSARGRPGRCRCGRPACWAGTSASTAGTVRPSPPCPSGGIRTCRRRCSRDRCRDHLVQLARRSGRPRKRRPAARDRPAARAARRRRRPDRPPRRPVECRGSSPSGFFAAGRIASGRNRPPRRRSAAAGRVVDGMSRRRMPLRPSPKAAQNGSLPMPIGLTTPMPVTTILRLGAIA